MRGNLALKYQQFGCGWLWERRNDIHPIRNLFVEKILVVLDIVPRVSAESTIAVLFWLCPCIQYNRLKAYSGQRQETKKTEDFEKSGATFQNIIKLLVCERVCSGIFPDEILGYVPQTSAQSIILQRCVFFESSVRDATFENTREQYEWIQNCKIVEDATSVDDVPMKRMS